MSDERNNPVDPANEDLPIGVLMRLASDGEITPGQQARLDAHFAANPGDRARVSFDIELRSCIDRASAENHAPEHLRDRVAAIFSEERAATGEDPAQPIVRSDRSFWARPRFAPLAIAAAILLAATAAIVVRPLLSQNIWMDPVARASVIAFVDNEHDRCASQECSSNKKWIARSVDDAESMASEYLGASPGPLSLDMTGFQVGGAGPCQIPGEGKSVHVLYRSSPEDLDAPTVSLFIQRAGEDDLVDYSCLCDQAQGATGREVLIWRRKGMVYYLRCPDPEIATQVLAALGAPSDRVPI